MKKIIFNIYRKLFARKNFYSLNRYLYTLSLKGIGINNYESDYYSGESYFMSKLKFLNNSHTIFDIGANIGNYSNHIISLFPNVKLFSFEPHPKIFKNFEKNKKGNYEIYNYGFGNEECIIPIYDYKDDAEGSEHASIHKGVFETIYKKETISYEIKLRKVDDFVLENKIDKITLLKTDTEGNDFNVLLGAKKSLDDNVIDIIHFEFNSMNTTSRVFFKDFFELLGNYDLYRLLPYSAIRIDNYEPVYNEIFGYQNIVAIRKNSEFVEIFN